jgi:hypothetical protein
VRAQAGVAEERQHGGDPAVHELQFRRSPGNVAGPAAARIRSG